MALCNQGQHRRVWPRVSESKNKQEKTLHQNKISWKNLIRSWTCDLIISHQVTLFSYYGVVLGRLIKHARQCSDKIYEDVTVELALWDDDDDNSWPTSLREEMKKMERRKRKEGITVSNRWDRDKWKARLKIQVKTRKEATLTVGREGSHSLTPSSLIKRRYTTIIGWGHDKATRPRR